MRSIVVVVALVLVLATLLGVLAWLSGNAAEPAAAPPELARSLEASPTTSAEIAPAGESTAAAAAEREEAPELQRDAPSDPAVVQSAECIVFGRIVDEFDAPLSGVRARLAAHKMWAEGHDVPRLSGPSEMRGFEVASDSAGVFRFDAPTPTAPRVVLTLEPDPFHDSERVSFAASDASSRPPLRAGENDLGLFRLVATGVIEGRVTDELGAPLADARLNIGDTRATTYERYGVSGADGSYRIAHVKAGSYGVNCKLSGWLNEFRKPFVVETGRSTQGVDFALRSAPTLSGVVVDARGAPLEGAKVWGWPKSSGAGAGATSAADGTFTVFLPQNEPYTLECKLAGFEPWRVQDRSIHHEPGTRDLRVELTRAALTRFRVVDARTKAPVERFGIAVYRENFATAPATTLGEHPGGEVELAASSPARERGVLALTYGGDHLVVRAEGYADFEGDVLHDSEGSNVQTVALLRAASLRGRAVLDGAPASGAEVVLESGRPEFELVDGKPVEQSASFVTDSKVRRTARAGDDGRFELRGVGAGRYRVTVRHPSGAVHLGGPLRVEAEREHDLGELTLLAAATITGRVLVPPGRELAGVQIHLDEWRTGAKASTDASGAFRFERVAPGEHTVWSAERAGQIMQSERVAVTAVSGGVHEVLLDLTRNGTCEVTLTIEWNGGAVENASVDLVGRGARPARRRLGQTDAAGRVTASVGAFGLCGVSVDFPSEVTIAHPDVVLDLQLDAKLEQRVRFDVAPLVLRLPEGLAMPSKCVVGLRFFGGDGQLVASTFAPLVDGHALGAVSYEAAARTIRLDTAPVGSFLVECTLRDPEAQLVATTTGESTRYEQAVLHKSSHSVSIALGAPTCVELR